MATLARGLALAPDGSPGVLLRRGDVFDEQIDVRKQNTPEQPFVVGAYGDGSAPIVTRIRISGAYVTLQDLQFLPVRDEALRKIGMSGMYVRGPLVGGLVQRSTFTYCGLSLLSHAGPVTDFRVDSIRVRDSYNHGAHAQGLFASEIDGLTIENSLFLHNGHYAPADAQATIFNHNLYIRKDNQRIVLRNNIIAQGASHGAQVDGGIVEGNLFVGNAIHMTFRDLRHGHGVLRGNVFLRARDIREDLPRGWGVEIGNFSSLDMSGNIFAHVETASGHAHAHAIRLLQKPDWPRGLQNADITDNIVYNHVGLLALARDAGSFSDVRVYGNSILEDDPAAILTGKNSAMLDLVDGVVAYDNRLSSPKPQPWCAVNGVATEHPAEDIVFADPSVTISDEWLERAWGGQHTAADGIALVRAGFSPVAELPAEESLLVRDLREALKSINSALRRIEGVEE